MLTRDKNLNISDSYGCFDVDIQEFYDTTLLDESKSVQQKTTETLQIVAKWEQTLTIAGGVPQQMTLQTEVAYIIHALCYSGCICRTQSLLILSLRRSTQLLCPTSVERRH